MLWLYVRGINMWDRARRWLREESGLTIIEYGVFAAFVVLLLVGAAITVGPQLKEWLEDTVTCITDKNAQAGPNGMVCDDWRG